MIRDRFGLSTRTRADRTDEENAEIDRAVAAFGTPRKVKLGRAFVLMALAQERGCVTLTTEELDSLCEGLNEVRPGDDDWREVA